MNKILLSLIVLSLLVVAACTTVGPENTTDDGITGEVIFNEDIFNEEEDILDEPLDDEPMENELPEDEPEEQPEEVVEESMKTLTYVEGDLIELALSYEDPDGDEITFSYSEPFNVNGKWQTNEGDAGSYLVTVTADDGVSTVSKDVRIVVTAANRAPTIECPELITVKEGDDVFVDCTIYDIDGEDSQIAVSFSGWIDTALYTTTFDDAGEHTVLVKASDAEGKTAQQEITIVVTDVNRKPIFLSGPEDIEAMEEDLVTVDVEGYDPDDDEVTIEYSEPFNTQGVWETALGDAGTYNAYVTITDGTEITTEEFTVTVNLLNTAPVFKEIPDITVSEGETVEIDIDATDREGDKIIIEFSGWMSKSTKATTFDDAYPTGCDEKGCSATYTTTVTVSDGILSSSQDVSITVKDKNRPPVFTFE